MNMYLLSTGWEVLHLCASNRPSRSSRGGLAAESISNCLMDTTDKRSFVTDLVIPPLNFAMVSPGVYRSGYPNSMNHSFLKSLQLKTLIYLCPENCDDSNVSFCKQNGVKILQFGIQGNKEPFSEIPEPVCFTFRPITRSSHLCPSYCPVQLPEPSPQREVKLFIHKAQTGN